MRKPSAPIIFLLGITILNLQVGTEVPCLLTGLLLYLSLHFIELALSSSHVMEINGTPWHFILPSHWVWNNLVFTHTFLVRHTSFIL